MISKQRILIYSDIGVSHESVDALHHYFQQNHHVSLVSGDVIQDRHWIDNTDLFIMPGGRSLSFYEALGDKGNANIRAFVEKGGRYVGLCAGAYYAAKNTIFAKGLPLELNLKGALNFFEGDAIGPVFADHYFAYGSEAGASMAQVCCCENNQVYPIYFNGGCTFLQVPLEEKGVFVLAQYVDNDLPAIIRCQVGFGCAILSGVHPELTPHGICDSIFKIMRVG